MPNKLTDKEIVKALECCSIEHACGKCPYARNKGCSCINGILKDALDLINRLQADNERFKKGLPMSASFLFEKAELDELLTRTVEAEASFKTKIKAEARKEFAERLKELMYQSSDWSHGEHPFVVEESDIENLLIEMDSENDGN